MVDPTFQRQYGLAVQQDLLHQAELDRQQYAEAASTHQSNEAPSTMKVLHRLARLWRNDRSSRACQGDDAPVMAGHLSRPPTGTDG